MPDWRTLGCSHRLGSLMLDWAADPGSVVIGLSGAGMNVRQGGEVEHDCTVVSWREWRSAVAQGYRPLRHRVQAIPDRLPDPHAVRALAPSPTDARRIRMHYGLSPLPSYYDPTRATSTYDPGKAIS